MARAPKKVDKKKYPKTPIGSTWVLPLRELIRLSLTMWRKNFKTLLGITFIYGAFYFLLVSGSTKIDLGNLQNSVEKLFGSGSSSVGVSVLLTGSIFGLSTTLNQTSGTYALLLFIINSLAFVWVLRVIWAKKPVSLREAYYKGMYPLIPTLIVLFVMLLQLLPLSIGAALMGYVFSNNIAGTLIETILFSGLFILCALASGYLLVGSIMAFYAATVPDMTPLNAMRAAKDLLKKRRLLVLQRVLLFTILSLLAAFVLLLIVVSILPGLVTVVVTLLTIFALPWSHIFLYNLYRSLIDA